MVVDACSRVVAVLVAAADETSHAEASQARQANQGIDSQIELDLFVIVDLSPGTGPG